MADETKKKVSIGEFFSQVRVEAAKIVWPSGEETVRTAIMVAIMATLLGLFFFGVDSLFAYVVRQLMALAA